jgi:hypothetical protein
MTPEQLTNAAHEDAAAVSRNAKQIREAAAFAGTLDALGAAYYSTIFAGRIPAQWRDVFLSELALMQMSRPKVIEGKTIHELFARGQMANGSTTSRSFPIEEPVPTTAEEALKLPAVKRIFQTLDTAILETKTFEFRTL